MDARDFKGLRIAATMPRGDDSHRSTRSRTDHETRWRDLATNLPGSAARAKAIELRRAAPVLTVLARALDVPEGWLPFCAVVLGHPDGQDRRSGSLEHVTPASTARIHWGTW